MRQGKQRETQQQANKANSCVGKETIKATADKALRQGSKKSGAQGTGGVKGGSRQGEVLYHNCIAIAMYMKRKTTRPRMQAPATQEQRAQAVNVIGKQWREHVRRQSEALGGKRRTAARLADLAQHNLKGNSDNKVVRNQKPGKTKRAARKLFIGVNLRAALDRNQAIGSSWHSEWDFG